jgi:hypothetical protein
MGREVRRVPADWKHPSNGEYTDGTVRYVPLFDGSDYESRVRDWDEESAKWARGEFPEYASEANRKLSYEEWNGQRPKAEDYMPAWPEGDRTHCQMYETTTEGTPISPVFATPEELARWLADNGASAFGDMTADYEHWLRVACGGFAPSAVSCNGVIESGVQGL